MNYLKNKEELEEVIGEVKSIIDNLTYEDCKKQNALFNKKTEADEVEYNIERRKKLVDDSYASILRKVERIEEFCTHCGYNKEIIELMKNVALLHDFGRILQPTIMATNTEEYFSKNGYEHKNHGDFGHFMLFSENIIERFDFEEKYFDALEHTTKWHCCNDVPDSLSCNIDEDDLNKLKQDNLNFSEDQHLKNVVRTIVFQVAGEVDCFNLLELYLNGETKINQDSIKRGIYNTTSKETYSLPIFAKQYNVSQDAIIEANKINEHEFTIYDLIDNGFDIDISKMNGKDKATLEEYSKVYSIPYNDFIACSELLRKRGNLLTVPIKGIDPKLLDIPDSIKERLLNGELFPLGELVWRPDYSQIVGFWWRVANFVNKMKLSSFAKYIKDEKILENLFNSLPDDYKPYCEEVIEYAKDILEEKSSVNNFYCDNKTHERLQ